MPASPNTPNSALVVNAIDLPEAGLGIKRPGSAGNPRDPPESASRANRMAFMALSPRIATRGGSEWVEPLRNVWGGPSGVRDTIVRPATRGVAELVQRVPRNGAGSQPTAAGKKGARSFVRGGGNVRGWTWLSIGDIEAREPQSAP